MFLAGSVNQPIISSCAAWNPNATTFSNISTIGRTPTDIFVSPLNTIYAAARELNEILIWPQMNTALLRNISSGLNDSYGLFVTNNGDIYVSNGYIGRVDKWTWNTTSSNTVMNFSSRCYNLFIDINNTLYCSNDLEHKITKTSLDDITQSIIVAAGNGTQGSLSTMLSYPYGIFVDTQLNVYVADCGNDRVQRFQVGQLNGTTIAGYGGSANLSLNCPVDITFDNAGYLFIVDQNQNRIMGEGPNGFQCIIGCSGISGSASDQLNQPRAFSFDSYGNIFVVDANNSRIQKFSLATNSCSKYTHHGSF